MYRKVFDALDQWKLGAYRKPLIVQGARQVGKTYAVLEFGHRRYDNVAYFNFETNPRLADAFASDISPAYLVPLLSRLANTTIVRERTLVVFDEVQLCERALTSLKYFCEQESDYHVIAAGSLLGVATRRATFSYPVGKVDTMTVRPMDFEEFLDALGEQELVQLIRKAFDTGEPLPPVLHEAALKRYREYLVVGGMPDAVRQFVETGDYVLVRHTQDSILAGYLDDMSKYNTENEIKKTRLAYNASTAQLSKPNTRFQYKLIKHGARAAEFENALEWLDLSGVILRVFRAEHPRKPLDDERDVDSFKVYLSDVGLLGAKKDIVPDDVLYAIGELGDFAGGMTENYVAAQLRANDYEPYYWASEGKAEVDFVIQRQGSLIPIEVKAGDNVRSRSLTTYVQRFDPDYAFRLSTRNYGIEGRKRMVPLYAAFCI